MNYNSKKHIFEENKEQILKMHNDGVMQKDIAKMYDVSVATVRAWIYTGGVRKQKSRLKAAVIYKEYIPPKHWDLVNSVLNRSQGRQPA